MRLRVLFLPFVAVSVQAQSEGTPYVVDVGFTALGTVVRNRPDLTLPFDENLLRPGEPETYPSMAMRAGIEAQPWRGVLFRALVDSGEIRPGSSLDPEVPGATTAGLSLEEAVSEGLFVREAAIEVLRRRWVLSVGRSYSKIGGGLVYEDYGTGGSADVELGRIHGVPLRLSMGGLLIGRTFSELQSGSTLWSLRVDLPLSLFEHISPFFAYYADRDGALRDVLFSAMAESWAVDRPQGTAEAILAFVAEADPPSRGDIVYVGADGMVAPAERLSLRAAAVGSTGTASLELASNETRSLRLRSFAADMEVHYGVTEQWDLGAFGMGLMGDRAPRLDLEEPQYAAFVAPAPYWAWTGLFFSGGLSQGFYPSRTSAAGVNGHGVVGLGPIVAWQGPGPLVELRAAWLRAVVDSPPPVVGGGGGASYGAEIDLRGDWDLGRWVTVAGELDVLFPGSFFPEDDTAWRFILLVDLHHEA